MTNVPCPQPGERLALEDGRANPTWWRFFKELATALNTYSSATDETKADKTQTICASFTFKFPENETVRLVLKSPFAWSITEVVTRTEAGTATVQVSIDGVALGGSANSASTAEQAQAHSSANSVAVGNDVEVTFSSTSADCENLTITIVGTRELD